MPKPIRVHFGKFSVGQKVRCIDFRPMKNGSCPEVFRDKILEVEKVYRRQVWLKGWFGYFHPDRFQLVKE